MGLKPRQPARHGSEPRQPARMIRRRAYRRSMVAVAASVPFRRPSARPSGWAGQGVAGATPRRARASARRPWRGAEVGAEGFDLVARHHFEDHRRRFVELPEAEEQRVALVEELATRSRCDSEQARPGGFRASSCAVGSRAGSAAPRRLRCCARAGRWQGSPGAASSDGSADRRRRRSLHRLRRPPPARRRPRPPAAARLRSAPARRGAGPRAAPGRSLRGW